MPCPINFVHLVQHSHSPNIHSRQPRGVSIHRAVAHTLCCGRDCYRRFRSPGSHGYSERRRYHCRIFYRSKSRRWNCFFLDGCHNHTSCSMPVLRNWRARSAGLQERDINALVPRSTTLSGHAGTPPEQKNYSLPACWVEMCGRDAAGRPGPVSLVDPHLLFSDSKNLKFSGWHSHRSAIFRCFAAGAGSLRVPLV